MPAPTCSKKELRSFCQQIKDTLANHGETDLLESSLKPLMWQKDSSSPTLFRLLGYSAKNLEIESKKVYPGGTKFKPDYILSYGKKKIILDLKHPSLHNFKKYHVSQVLQYCKCCEAEIGVLFNGGRIGIYLREAKTDINELMKLNFDETPLIFASINDKEEFVSVLYALRLAVLKKSATDARHYLQQEADKIEKIRQQKALKAETLHQQKAQKAEKLHQLALTNKSKKAQQQRTKKIESVLLKNFASNARGQEFQELLMASVKVKSLWEGLVPLPEAKELKKVWYGMKAQQSSKTSLAE